MKLDHIIKTGSRITSKIEEIKKKAGKMNLTAVALVTISSFF